MSTEIASAVIAAGLNAQYDAQVKRLHLYEYGRKYNRREVENMCNLSEWVEEKAAKKATEIAIRETTERVTKDVNESFILNMAENNFSIEQISLATKKSISEIEEVLKEKKIVYQDRTA